ncbi:hypothetical protein Ancab_010772 [Ancistrocladus abbreviatus]
MVYISLAFYEEDGDIAWKIGKYSLGDCIANGNLLSSWAVCVGRRVSGNRLVNWGMPSLEYVERYYLHLRGAGVVVGALFPEAM